MSANSSSSNDSDFVSNLICFLSKPNSFIFNTYNITFILLLLPLCIFILHHGLQLWRQKRSASSAVTVSHSNIFTYHLVAMELVAVFGSVFRCCGVFREDSIMIFVGGILYSFTWCGETFFHVLTCVERYLAVVHPITYLSLRNQRWVRIRNISLTCVWLLSFVITSLLFEEIIYVCVDFCVMIFSLITTSFCSLSVLCVLIRPGPGEQGGCRGRVDQSKLRAFYTIVVILGVLVLRFIWDVVWAVLYLSKESFGCEMLLCGFWISLPSSLVLPLLFLHRAGKLVCCKNN